MSAGDVIALVSCVVSLAGALAAAVFARRTLVEQRVSKRDADARVLDEVMDRIRSCMVGFQEGWGPDLDPGAGSERAARFRALQSTSDELFVLVRQVEGILKRSRPTLTWHHRALLGVAYTQLWDLERAMRHWNVLLDEVGQAVAATASGTAVPLSSLEMVHCHSELARLYFNRAAEGDADRGAGHIQAAVDLLVRLEASDGGGSLIERQAQLRVMECEGNLMLDRKADAQAKAYEACRLAAACGQEWRRLRMASYLVVAFHQPAVVGYSGPGGEPPGDDWLLEGVLRQAAAERLDFPELLRAARGFLEQLRARNTAPDGTGDRRRAMAE
ncbi:MULTISPECIES: hypothetical protein [unclassified Streptomyces]|uniref:hypothetical protein n=1 Tax=unclassified Streptomyces TaxID=2593676 RepID=UPI00278C3C31|nr:MULTISPECIES: hypothetical protein [unclassified Streptomyces]